MSEVPAALLDGMSDALNALSEDARAILSAAIMEAAESLALPDGTIPPEAVAALREAALEAARSYGPMLSDDAAALAAELYDEVRRLSDPGGDFSAVTRPSYSPERVESRVRYLAGDVTDLESAAAFAAAVAAQIDYEARRSANECAARNAARDPAKPRFARVPRGSETCAFCIMLASRGFVYTTTEAASHAHAGCDCRVVQGYRRGGEDLTRVEGYDPDGLYRMYMAGRESAIAAAEERWGSMSRAQRGGQTKNDYVTKAVLSAMRAVGGLEH